MQRYDFIIAGGGCAGLSLLNAILESPLRTKKIAIIDREIKQDNDRTWCFWSDSSNEFPFSTVANWQSLEFFTNNDFIEERLDPYQYSCIFSEDFYRPILKKASHFSNVDFITGDIIDVIEEDDYASVYTNVGSFSAKQVFSSLWKKAPFTSKFFLWQNFSGWFIRTQKAVFNTNTIRLMDFRVPQDKETQFFYVLPFSEDFALVELTKFETQTSDFSSFQAPIESYIEKSWQLTKKDYSIERTERGRIPMTDADFSQSLSKHIFPIGTSGGNTKPTTGYTFKRIQSESTRIVASLLKNEPLTFNKRKNRFQFYDHLLLSILSEKPQIASSIFLSLFKNNSASNVLRFLDEETSLIQDINLIKYLPWSPFLSALWKEYIAVNSNMENHLTFPKPQSI